LSYDLIIVEEGALISADAKIIQSNDFAALLLTPNKANGSRQFNLSLDDGI
jgi:hypothetical protein